MERNGLLFDLGGNAGGTKADDQVPPKGSDDRRKCSSTRWSIPLNSPEETPMPPRMIDGEALWASEKLHRCNTTIPATIAVYYPWFYPLADAYGSFEITSLRVIHGKIAANLEFLTLDHTKAILDEFQREGLLFVWEHQGKRFAHWTNSDRPGRLPKPSERHRYRRLAPEVPATELARYMSGPNPPTAPTASTAPSVAESSPAAESAPTSQPSRPSSTLVASDTFETFWKIYPNKQGKPAARRAWAKIPGADQHLAEILAGVERWKTCAQWSDPQYIPYPAKFLNQQRYNDQPPAGTGGISKHEQQQRRTLEAARRTVARSTMLVATFVEEVYLPKYVEKKAAATRSSTKMFGRTTLSHAWGS